jgi:nicotinamidase-related amidase
VVVGLATDYCVKETALDAVRLGFDTVVLGELVRAVDTSKSAPLPKLCVQSACRYAFSHST